MHFLLISLYYVMLCDISNHQAIDDIICSIT